MRFRTVTEAGIAKERGKKGEVKRKAEYGELTEGHGNGNETFRRNVIFFLKCNM